MYKLANQTTHNEAFWNIAMDAVAASDTLLYELERGDQPVSPADVKLPKRDDHFSANQNAKKQRAIMKFALSCRRRKLAFAKQEEYEEREFDRLYAKFNAQHMSYRQNEECLRDGIFVTKFLRLSKAARASLANECKPVFCAIVAKYG